MSFVCKEVKSLPEGTIRTSSRTARKLTTILGEQAVDMICDDSLPDHGILMSSDLYENFVEFLTFQGQAEAQIS